LRDLPCIARSDILDPDGDGITPAKLAVDLLD
jgi:hypothetical protein